MTEFVKISTLVLVQQQQLGSLLLSSRSTLRLAAVAVRLVIPLLYSLKRFDAEGPLLLRPMRRAMRLANTDTPLLRPNLRRVKSSKNPGRCYLRRAAKPARPGGAPVPSSRVVDGDWAAPWRASRRRHDSESQEHLVIWRPS